MEARSQLILLIAGVLGFGQGKMFTPPQILTYNSIDLDLKLYKLKF